ncbi:MAG: hypothetical protein ACI4RA_07165 [Kiritimatiellia bacterium]
MAGAVGIVGSALLAAEVQYAQSVALVKGWNAFYLTVAPQQSASELFADWPVDFVGAYDQAAFQKTRQYSGTGSSEGVATAGYRVWHRGDAGASTFSHPSANTVYVCFATNAMPARFVYGRPFAPRISWHRSVDDGTLNQIGFSTSEATTIGDYLAGIDVDNTTYKTVWGTDPAAPRYAVAAKSERIAPGAVIFADSSKVSDWSGSLNVSPVSGVDFGTNLVQATVEVRNDGAAARTVKVALSVGSAANLKDVPPVPTGLMVKDVSTAAAVATNRWADFTPSAPFTRSLAAGETMTLALALDRTRLTGPVGTYYGGLLSVSDEDGGSKMRVVMPVEATGDGGASGETAWPKGIWLATAEFETVTSIGRSAWVTNSVPVVSNAVDEATGEVTVVTNYKERVELVSPISEAPAGGTMKVRLPMVVDRAGKMTLLQRFWYGRDTEGTLHVIAGSETSDVPLVEPRRVSTAFLPTDQVKIPAGSGTFGTTATFPFVVSETSNVNPMRHAYHPQHDGKRFDFKTPSPSGDALENYVGTIKPELFSITNTVNFAWTPTQGTAWNPDETLTGTLTWEFGGIRHESVIRAKGPFVMKRISAATVEK